MKYDLSIIIPTINPNLLIELYDQLISSVGSPYTFELICVGPLIPPKELIEKSNFKFYVDAGCPSRCLQLGSCFAEGNLITILSDDCRFCKNAISECIQLLYSKTQKDGINLRYSEGVNYTGNNDEIEEYWTAGFHGDLILPGIKPDWKLALCFMYYLSYFRELGGLDCRFEHTNMNTHDLAFRIQKNGGVIYPSPSKVSSINFNWPSATGIMYRTYIENDLPLFQQLYSVDDPNRIKINYDNWMNVPNKWPRRYPNG